MRASLASFLLVLLLAPVAFAQTEPTSVVVDGVSVALPDGWISTPTSSAQDGIRRVVANEQDGDSLYPGAKLVVEVVPSLNRLQQERWLRGQLLRGLNASDQIEPVGLGVVGASTGAAVSFRGGGRAGYALYTRGGAFYSVRLSAPPALWADATTRDALLALMRSVRVAG
ncbi:MAG: hypothetical protein AAGF99_00735 [Bacteroidota bacterium]